jgi:signal recognition particle subunit SRP54
MTENAIAPALKSVRRALLDADVNLDVATALIDGVKRRSLGTEVIRGVTAEQMFVKAMYDEVGCFCDGLSANMVRLVSHYL